MHNVLVLGGGVGGTLVAKVADPAEGGRAVEARMLRYLAEHSALPVPQVIYADDGLLLMDFPGKRRLEIRLVCFGPLDKAVNWIRRRANQPPFELPESPGKNAS